MAHKFLFSKWIVLFGVLSLTGGCATRTADNYTPFVPQEEMYNKLQYAVDLNNCRWIAHEYLQQKNGVDVRQAAEAGVTHALDNLTNPLSTAGVTGAGGAASNVLTQEGMNSDDVRHILANCMHDKGQASGAYHVYDPQE